MIPRTADDFKGDSRPSGDQINFKTCPVCGSTAWKVFVDPVAGKWVCFGGRHPAPPGGGYPGGNLRIEGDGTGQHLLDMLRASDTPIWSEMELPNWEPLSSTAKLYLKRRGVSPDEQRQLGLVEWADKYRIVMPYFDRSGQLIYWNSRRFSDKLGEGPKYLTAPGKHPLFVCSRTLLPPRAIDPPYPRVIVEGYFDAVAVSRTGCYMGVALGGKSLPDYLQSYLLTELEGCGIIYILLDHDATAQAVRLAGVLNSKPGIRGAIVKHCPAGLDPGDMTPDQIREVLQ